MPRSSRIVLCLAFAAVTACREAAGPAPGEDVVAPAVPPPADPAAAAVPATPAIPASPASAWQAPQRVLFLHRSVGLVLIHNGAVDMYDQLAQLNADRHTAIEMWHHCFGSAPYWNRYYDGADAQVTPNFGPAVTEPWEASPEHWKKIFCDGDPQYVAARDSIDNFRVVVFKSGYDNTVKYATDRAVLWRQLYRTMRSSPIFADPRRRIILLGFPPTRKGLGTATQADADSSRAFNDWLTGEFVRTGDNLFAFPLFDRLAGEDNWLRDEYELVDYPNDAHPNAYGCEIVGRALMTFIHDVARGAPRPRTPVSSPRSEPRD